MRCYVICWAFLVALIGTCRADANVDGTIDIDGAVDALPAAISDAELLAELSGDGPANVGGATTDDEDLLTTEGSGGNNNEIVDNGLTFTTLSSKTTMHNGLGGGQMKPKSTEISNAIGNDVTYQEANDRNMNDALGGDKPPQDINAEPKNFFEMMFKNPGILAGMVGVVVLILLTVVLVFLFVIYRIKKKDEGSYSLDEPHKVKDPTAYWKDTKEFYA